MSEHSANPIAPRSSAKCGIGGFPKGTLVWGNLGLVAVDELRPGDRILVIDARSGAEIFCPVTEAFEQADKRLVLLALESGEMVAAHPDQPYRLETNEIKPAHEVAKDDVASELSGNCSSPTYNCGGAPRSHALIFCSCSETYQVKDFVRLTVISMG